MCWGTEKRRTENIKHSGVCERYRSFSLSLSLTHTHTHSLPFWSISLPLELEGSVVGQVLSTRSSVGLRPLHLAWVTLHLEVIVALGPAETKHLFFFKPKQIQGKGKKDKWKEC